MATNVQEQLDALRERVALLERAVEPQLRRVRNADEEQASAERRARIRREEAPRIEAERAENERRAVAAQAEEFAAASLGPFGAHHTLMWPDLHLAARRALERMAGERARRGLSFEPHSSIVVFERELYQEPRSPKFFERHSSNLKKALASASVPFAVERVELNIRDDEPDEKSLIHSRDRGTPQIARRGDIVQSTNAWRVIATTVDDIERTGMSVGESGKRLHRVSTGVDDGQLLLVCDAPVFSRDAGLESHLVRQPAYLTALARKAEGNRT